MKCERVLGNYVHITLSKRRLAHPKLVHASSITASQSPRRIGMSRLKQATRATFKSCPCRGKIPSVDRRAFLRLFVCFLGVAGQCRQKHRIQTGLGSTDRCAVPADLPDELAFVWLSFLEAGAVRVCCRSVVFSLRLSTTLTINSASSFLIFFSYCNHFRGLEKGINLRGGGVGKERGLLSCVNALTRTAVVGVVRLTFTTHWPRRSEKACVAPCVGVLRPSEKSEFCSRELHAIFFFELPRPHLWGREWGIKGNHRPKGFYFGKDTEYVGHSESVSVR